MQQQIIFSQDINQSLSDSIAEISFDKLYILTDEHTARLCLPLIAGFTAAHPHTVITIPSGDQAKNIDSLSLVWMRLSESGATRRSLLINLGGGMITDLGGFAAASFKRGISFINIPTTLLGAVDASVGGKTGINFNGLKNEIGAFAPARAVLISTRFFDTLDNENLLSGYAEMLKHGLLDSPATFEKLLSYDVRSRDNDRLLQLLEESVLIKRRVVIEDPYEKGLRKALNLGHTVGHAFESFCMQTDRPVLHGYAVAWGLVCELILAHRLCDFPIETMRRAASFVSENYGALPFTCRDYETLFNFMTHDKKNEDERINFTLLAQPGQIRLDCHASQESIFIMFDIYCDMFGL